MEYVDFVVLLSMGLILIFGSKKIALETYRRMPRFLQSKIGKPEDEDNFYITYNRWGAMIIGIVAVVASFTVIFGPISL